MSSSRGSADRVGRSSTRSLMDDDIGMMGGGGSMGMMGRDNMGMMSGGSNMDMLGGGLMGSSSMSMGGGMGGSARPGPYDRPGTSMTGSGMGRNVKGKYGLMSFLFIIIFHNFIST